MPYVAIGVVLLVFLLLIAAVRMPARGIRRRDSTSWGL